MVVCVVSILVGQTTLVISLLESKIIFNASFPSFVVIKMPREINIKKTTPRTLYKRGSKAK